MVPGQGPNGRFLLHAVGSALPTAHLPYPGGPDDVRFRFPSGIAPGEGALDVGTPGQVVTERAADRYRLPITSATAV